ncbi:hypothetical protein [Candidatus Soleaferrea massiliensis]|uniref:hypothetical protein n=1 Tax=Candidatus Soleaferrea massiliensis TaxID=1470354 RepID=UPI00059038E5|nr:hypothetical protein [Candidatus Soleaferrea massiliensis]
MGKKLLLLLLPLGILMVVAATVCSNCHWIGDFQKGFLEGMGAVSMLIGTGFLVWFFVRRRKDRANQHKKV